MGNNSNGTLTIADINALARQNRELKEKFDKISNDYDLLLNNLKDLIKENTNNVHNN